MIALFGGIAHAPLAVMLMVGEMTGNLNLLAPAMVAVAISLLVCGNKTIYVNQIATRAESPAHRYQFSFPLLASLPVLDVIKKLPIFLSPDMKLAEADHLLTETERSGLPVIDGKGSLIGVLTRADLHNVVDAQHSSMLVNQVMTTQPVAVPASDQLDRVLELMAEHSISWLPVVEDEINLRFLGVVGASEVVKAYQKGVSQGVRNLGATVSGMSLQELQLGPHSISVNKALSELELPADTLVTAIHRNGELVIPRGNTRLLNGDVVTVMTGSKHSNSLDLYFGAKNGEMLPMVGLVKPEK